MDSLAGRKKESVWCVCVRLGCTKTDVVDDDGVGAVDDSCFLSRNALVLSLLTRSALLLDRVSEHRPKLLLLCCVSRSEVTLRVLSLSLLSVVQYASKAAYDRSQYVQSSKLACDTHCLVRQSIIINKNISAQSAGPARQTVQKARRCLPPTLNKKLRGYLVVQCDVMRAFYFSG